MAPERTFNLLVMPKYDCNLWELLKAAQYPNAFNNSEGFCDYLTSDASRVPLATRWKMIETILNVMVFIQQNRYCHLDLKPSNILLNLRRDNTWNEQDLVLADFGLASSFEALTGNCGTPGFGSPEQFTCCPSEKSDNYAFGKLLILILFDWQLAWNMLAQPISQKQQADLNLDLNLGTKLGKHISGLLQVFKFIK